ncbi:hypothetical protein H5T54_00005, partial [Candidatus Bipolaricaulota bacterium]|nr:hypothetical protein [Candidatus Bipolaricaulota bacterium]
ETVELLERPILVRQKEGVRPSERMTAFTGYLVTARKRLPAIWPGGQASS